MSELKNEIFQAMKALAEKKPIPKVKPLKIEEEDNFPCPRKHRL